MSENEEISEELKGVCDLEELLLVVYDDDFNTLDWAIQCFMEVCDYTHDQSEKLTLLIHSTGKAIVKTGDREKLRFLKEALVNRGFSAVIETKEEN